MCALPICVHPVQSIPQLIELFKHFQSSAFIFFTQIEPLILADSIPDSLSKKINNTDFPFRYPINADTDNDGDIITSMCTWSLIKCPSIISTCLYLHNSLNISPKSFRYWLYITFRLYFGVKMMWYLHIHFVCAKEFALLAIIITILSYFDSLNTFIIERMVIILYNIFLIPPA